MDVALVFGKSLGLSAVICGAVLVLTIAIATFWVRVSVRDKAYCFFLSENKQLKGKILKPIKNSIILGKGDDAPQYIVHSSKQFWSFWPPGFPRWIQEPVPTLFYVEGNAEPLDPYDRTSLISPESLRRISDEAMLKQTWKDVRETLGIKSAFGGNTLLLILVTLVLLTSAAAVYLGYSNMHQSTEILKMLGG